MIPGPTNVNPLVLGSLARPTLSHVSVDFANILKETLKDLGQLLGTAGLILPLAGTGTLGSEIALANILEPGDRVLAICGGYFGERLADVAVTLGANVDRFHGAPPQTQTKCVGNSQRRVTVLCWLFMLTRPLAQQIQ